MSIDAHTLQQVVNDVCAGMLGLSMEPAEAVSCDEADALSAVIRISGGWNSLVQVLTPMTTARVIASRMFATDESDLTEADILDAVGEIVNMVGGNLKGIVEVDSSLSLPCVGQATGEAPFGDDFEGISVTNRCEGDSLVVRLLDPTAVG
ncbi:MAG: chemotaxis protein CheX [Planctomycetaceae bacterium]|nr:chemotaxis protein CheX [Planctomycetaceae bacterium]